jgi:hypothetical protein
MEMRGRTTFEAISENQTKLTLIVDIPSMDASMDKTFLNSRLENSAQIRKQLMESEIYKYSTSRKTFMPEPTILDVGSQSVHLTCGGLAAL